MIRFRFKIDLAILFALIIGLSFFYLNYATQRLLHSHSEILHQLTDLDLHNEQINKEVLNAAYRLYDTYDRVNLLLQKVRSNLALVKSNPILRSAPYRKISNKLQLFDISLNKKEKAIEKFITLNAMIKNSATYVPSLSTRYLQGFDKHDKEYLLELLNITSAVFLAHNAMDADLLEAIESSINKLKLKQFDSEEEKNFNRLFLSHAQVMTRYLPLYRPIFENILSGNSSQLLHEIEESFVTISTREANKLSSISYAVMLAFLLSIALIVFLLFNVEKSRRKQVQLHRELQYRATTDSLTRLDNRFAFLQEEQLLNDSHALLLINIDSFKDINDFYGRQIGDRALKHISKVIKQFANAISLNQIYRVGTDDFALIVKNKTSKELMSLTQDLIVHIESRAFIFQDIQLFLRVSAGITNTSPLLETADLALRKIKNTRNKLLLYSPEQDLEKQAKENLTMMQFIQEAINKDYIVPHFMPLMRNTDETIVAFECLIRLQDEQGKLYFPDEFLPVAKKCRLYGDLTKIMVEKCFKKFANVDYLFSINLSIEDIEDNDVSNFIFAKLEQFPETGKRLMIEILESEDVQNYSCLQYFVDKVRPYGCRIAIDDYGSGYSNLQHLLNMQVDSLKIDGSLVEQIATNQDTSVVVNTIVDMAEDMGISTTTAEYVANKEVFKEVQSLNITYSQGYYIGKALPELITTPDYATK